MPIPMRLLVPLLLSNAKTEAQQYSESVIATSPLAYFRMNEKSGTTLVDSSGNGYDGTIVGTTLNTVAAPKTGDTAHSFDGVNDVDDADNATFLSTLDAGNMSLLIWFKLTDPSETGTNRQLFEVNLNGSNRLFARKTTTANQVQVAYIAGGTSNGAFLTVSDTNWHVMLVQASDAANSDAFIVRLDGSEEANLSSNGTFAAGSVTVFLGAASNPATAPFLGARYGDIFWNETIDAGKIALEA